MEKGTFVQFTCDVDVMQKYIIQTTLGIGCLGLLAQALIK